MQFKYPELLWGLLLLVIPILIHLFQLRRFKKTPFTNVKFLKQVVSESRKSSLLKKWLLLFTRMGLLAALVLAFAQPFIANETALQEKETVFYLDDSFSMKGQTENGSLFKNAIQDFIKYVPSDQRFTLFTNKQVFKDVIIKDIQNNLLNLSVGSEQLGISEIILKGKTFFTDNAAAQKNLVLISDFQRQMGDLSIVDSTNNINVQFIKPSNAIITNTAIDTVFIAERSIDNIELVARLSTNSEEKTIPVSLYNNDKLIAKTAANFDGNKKADVQFTIPANDSILGKVTIMDTGLDYDNQFFFNIDKKLKIKVLAIGNSSIDYLKRIYTDDEFSFTSSTLEQLNYSTIENQDLVVLNEISKLPNSLITALKSLSANGGSFVLIPAINGDITSYNLLATTFNGCQFTNTISQEMSIANVKTAHTLFRNVFDKQVSDFQFPSVQEHFKLKTNASVALAFQNNEPFLVGSQKAYFFAAAISSNNSNFKNSPLIVPAFYNMGMNSLKLPPLYATIGNHTEIELPITLQQDDIIKIANDTNEFIPKQRVLPNKVQVNFIENPKEAGIFRILNNDKTIRHISFNNNRKESELVYAELPNDNSNTSVSNFFLENQKNNAINEFWKWFAILALAFVLIETALQRIIK
ncbi:BatA domain-containing protein [Maribacter ulvicola]|uniref:N-terminal double-transmembrane domain-containing protein n=1 Tax=Maribacter ulvicola TaxID=228959 RepID=A0A1N6V967_9FLAO|nr:BatA domain-containing protein [Maribacter ulvicola]SIQ74421.1 N-terminal double-transmembrane domain-containing protein [Maribacter ulvicola]